MSYDQRLADCENALNEANLEGLSWKASAEQNYAEWEQANKLLEQTIEVLEEFERLVIIPGRLHFLWGKHVKPLLDNLKAREKNHGSA